MILKDTLLSLLYKEEDKFNKELINISFDRSRIFLIILFIISLILLYIDFLNKQKGLWVQSPGYYYLFFIHLIFLVMPVIFLPFFLMNKIVNCKYMRVKQVSVILIGYFVIINCSLTSVCDQLIHGQITVFILGTFTIAVMNYYKPIISFGIFFVSYSIFIIGITFVQKNPAVLKGHYINGIILVVIAWFLSIILYFAKVRDFQSRKTIEHQKCELQKANQQLTTTNCKLQESLSALDESQNIIFTLALALESKDPYSHGHSERVVQYALELVKFLNLSEVDQLNIYRAAVLHDIGKIGIPDAILNKQSALSSEEWLIMRSHPERGEAICSKLNFAREILPIIRHHHERYDGKGYPDGLSGESIPFLARIVSIADTVDAITSSRPYRSAGMFEQALEELEKHAGTQFDPVLVRAFISLYSNKTCVINRVSIC